MKQRHNASVTYAATDYVNIPQSDSIDEKQFQTLYRQSVPTKKCSQNCKSWFRKTCTPTFWKTWFPPLTWMREYKNDTANKIRGDIIAGITVAIIVIPQALSYASLALLNPVVGFYTTIFPSFVYMLLGTSHECHIGPFALVSLLTADGIGAIMDPESSVENVSAPYFVAGLEFESYYAASTNMATVMSMFVGLFQICFGIFGIGQIVTAVIADPFVSGFTTGAAFLIATSQLSGAFQVYNHRSTFMFETLANVTGAVANGEANWCSFTVAVICFALLFTFRHINKTILVGKIPIPGELVVVVSACLVSHFADLNGTYNMTIVGDIPTGLPVPAVPVMNSEIVGVLIGPAITVSIIGYIVSIAVAKLYADRNNYEINGTQELIALGTGNIVGCFFSCYPAAASLSRTAVVDNAGGRTQLHNIFTVVILLVVLYGLAFLLYPLPRATLSAIVYSALIGLFLGFRQLRQTFVLKWQDGVIWLFTFIATVGAGVTVGIGVGVGFSLLIIIYRASRPYNAILGRIPGTNTYRSVRRYTTVQVEKVKIFRFDASLNFVNRAYFEECLMKVATGKHIHSKVDNGIVPEIIIIQCSTINSIDISALRSLTKMTKVLKKRKQTLLICSAKWDIRNLLTRAAREQRRQVELAKQANEHNCDKKKAHKVSETDEKLLAPSSKLNLPPPLDTTSEEDEDEEGENEEKISLQDANVAKRDLGGEEENEEAKTMMPDLDVERGLPLSLIDMEQGSSNESNESSGNKDKKIHFQQVGNSNNSNDSDCATSHIRHGNKMDTDKDENENQVGGSWHLNEHSHTEDTEDDLEFEDDAFAIIKSRHIFPNLNNALLYVEKKYGYVFEKHDKRMQKLGHVSSDDEEYEEGEDFATSISNISRHDSAASDIANKH